MMSLLPIDLFNQFTCTDDQIKQINVFIETFIENYNIKDEAIPEKGYYTSYYDKNVRTLFKDTCNIALQNIENIVGHKIKTTWFQIYHSSNFFNLHTHRGKDYKSLSGILYLDDYGSTVFLNPKYDDHETDEYLVYRSKSIKNRLIVFPNNLPHYVPPHNVSNVLRKIVSFNFL